MSRFTEQFLDEIKARLRPSEFIGRSVPLKKAGREYVGLSPFNKEKTPSFYVNDEKGQFFDFSSGKTGDLIEFLMETQRLTFPEAVEQLAAAAGLQMPARDERSAAQETQRQGVADWLGIAASWFEGELRRPTGRAAAAYLEKRGLPSADWGRFRIGFAPAGRSALKDYLVTKGVAPGAMADTGLTIKPEDGGQTYDRFRDRIMFPITDARGRIVSFGGRAMDANARAKYLNGPETPVFHKGSHLYGLFEARKILAAASTGEDAPLVVVEGYMDVIACHRAHIAAVAPMGTALGEEQMASLWRYHPEPTLCFDGDRAGRQAASRAIDKALPALTVGHSLKFASVEGGKDPDDVLRDQGPEALRAQLARTTSFADALFARERDLEPLDTPERKTALKMRLRKLADAISDRDLSQAYRDDLYARYVKLWGRPEVVRTKWERGKPQPLPGAGAGTLAAAERLQGSTPPLLAALAIAAIDDPDMIDAVIEQVGAHGFCDGRLTELAQTLVGLRFDGGDIQGPALLRRLDAAGYGAGEIAALRRDASRAGVSAPFMVATGDRRRELWRQAFALVVQLRGLERAVDAASLSDDIAGMVALKTDRDALRRRLNSDWLSKAPD